MCSQDPKQKIRVKQEVTAADSVSDNDELV